MTTFRITGDFVLRENQPATPHPVARIVLMNSRRMKTELRRNLYFLEKQKYIPLWPLQRCPGVEFKTNRRESRKPRPSPISIGQGTCPGVEFKTNRRESRKPRPCSISTGQGTFVGACDGCNRQMGDRITPYHTL